MPDLPNILLILTDQQSATMLSCARNEYVHTPAMDGLAAEGVRFPTRLGIPHNTDKEDAA
jgi:choline-sulfatase